ncbi:MAG: VanZ family protein [Clostridia bacterium]|nr:VanZ family protein [Clostridia bacterium]
MRSRKKLLLALLIAIFITMALIFFFSSQDDKQSSSFSGKVTDFVLSVFVPGYKDMTAAQQRPYRKSLELIIRKLAHFSEFALLGALLFRYFSVRRTDGRLLPALPVAWVLTTLYACTDELHQKYVSGRGPSPVDVGIDSAGALTGALLTLAVIALLRRRAGKR